MGLAATVMTDESSAAEPTPAVASVRRIAVLRPNHRIGNTLLLTPLVQELMARFPGAQIDVVTACGETTAVFEHYEAVRTVHTFPTHSYRHPMTVGAHLLALRREAYDLAIDPTLRSRAGRFLLGWVRARDRVGFRWGVGWRDRMLTHVADPASAPRHFAQAPLHLLRSAYSAPEPRLDGRPGRRAPPVTSAAPLELRLTESEQRLGELRLAGALGSPSEPERSAMRGPTLAIFAHASGQKDFPIDWWRELIDAVRRGVPDVQFVEIIPADRVARLPGIIPGLHTPQLRLLGATLAASSLVVIPDGGVMHLAEAAGARVLGLFKATDPSQYGPTRAGSDALWAREVSAQVVADRICAALLGRAARNGGV
jgi:ADP-heptose:LPS heptosyltransferase